jgi:arabinose-5-phosphate isomerase
MTGNPRSTVATHSGIHLSTRVEREACPLQLAPTASTTATLAMGDALAVALMKARRFEAHHFARFHPGGSLGRRLLKRVRDEMRSENLPVLGVDDDADKVVSVINACRLGVGLVCDGAKRALGIITDGDLRRALKTHGRDFFSLTARELMTPKPVTISIDSTMQAAFERMAKHEITLLVVTDDTEVAGVIQK